MLEGLQTEIEQHPDFASRRRALFVILRNGLAE
jgi:hypothetical protein